MTDVTLQGEVARVLGLVPLQLNLAAECFHAEAADVGLHLVVNFVMFGEKLFAGKALAAINAIMRLFFVQKHVVFKVALFGKLLSTFLANDRVSVHFLMHN